VNGAEAFLLVAVAVVPVLAGVAAGYRRRPWWWAAGTAAVVAVAAAILPSPEEGESRVTVGDVPFLLVLVLFVAGLAWLGALVGRALARRRGAA